MIGEILLLFGAVLMLLSAIALVRLRDVLLRMHALAMASTTGMLLSLTGAAISLSGVSDITTVLLAALLNLLTTPVAANLLSRATYRATGISTELIGTDEFKAGDVGLSSDDLTN